MESDSGVKNAAEPWNLWDLQPPPAATVKTFMSSSDIENMKKTFYKAISLLKRSNVFHKEAAILSRFLYKYKRIFRQDKGVLLLVKVNQALTRYLKLNVLDTLVKFTYCLPEKVPRKSDHVYLPTQQMMKWVLLRILALSKIFLRIINLTTEAGKYVYGKMKLGWSPRYTFTCLALTARILVCAKFVLSNIVEWYDQLRPHLHKLQSTWDYVPGYTFPVVLRQFIGDIDLKPSSKKADIDKIFEIIDLTKVEDDEDDDVIITNEVILNEIYEDIEIEHEEITVEDEDEILETGSDDLAVVYEKNRKSQEGFRTKRKIEEIEDLGEPVNVKKFVRKKKKRKSKRKIWKVS